MFKKLKNKVNSGSSSSPSSSGGGISGMAFRGGPPTAAKPGTSAARPSWSTSLDPDRPNATPQSLSPMRDGIAFIDARVAMVPPKELGYLLAAMAKLQLRPVLVPALAKIVGQVIKAKGNSGVMKERTIIENHLTAALAAAKAPEDVIAQLNPALDMMWVGDKKYALEDVVEENVWLALVEGVEDNGENRPAMAASGVKQTTEALKQSADRLTITGEVVCVSRNTLGPHILFAGDEILEAAAVKDAGGPNLTGTTFKNIDKAGTGFRSQADADAFVRRILEKARIDSAAKADEPAPIPIDNDVNPFGAPNGNGSSAPGTSPTQSLWLRNADVSGDPYGE